MTTRAAFNNISNAGNNKGLKVQLASNKRGRMLANKGKENMVQKLKGVSKPVVARKPILSHTRVATKTSSKPAPVEIAEVLKVAEAAESCSMDTDEDVGAPLAVEDIDQLDSGNPQLCSEYAPQIYQYLRGLESRPDLVVHEDYLSGCPITGKMRAVLVDWLVEVQQQFKLLQETLFLTLGMIDRYLAKSGKTVHKSQLQLVGVAAMFLASKIEEVYAPEINDFVYITDNAYTEEEIRSTELRLLNTLCFDFSKPISLTFLRRFSKAGDVDMLQHTLAKYTLEHALVDYSMVSLPPSQLAAAALHLSLLLLEPIDAKAPLASVWSANLQHYSGYTSSQLLPIISRLASMMAKVPSSKLQAVRTKYSSSKLMQVCHLPQLTGDMMMRLVRL